jgi:hypothetical protein
LQVRDCVARDVANINVVKLTDEHGCVLRPKLIGAFQKTRETGASGSSIIAYAFFQVKCNSSFIQKHCLMIIELIVTLIKHLMVDVMFGGDLMSCSYKCLEGTCFLSSVQHSLLLSMLDMFQVVCCYR